MGFWSKFGRSLMGVFVVTAALALLAMMIITVVNVFGRGFFKAPILGAVEMAQLSSVILISLVLGYAQLHRRSITVRIVVDRLPKQLGYVLEKVTLLLSLGIVSVLIWSTFSVAWEAFLRKEYTETMALRIAPFKFIWVIGWITLCGILIKNLFDTWLGRMKK